MSRRYRTATFWLLAAVLLAASVYLARRERLDSPEAPGAPGARGVRVVLVTLDTLRFDSFRGGDGRSSQMPKMAARAARGAVWERCFSSTSSTQPTHATLFTGLHPWQHGVSRNGQILDAQHRTITEAFRHAGFRTLAVVGSFPVSRHFGFAEGFDEFDDSLDRGSPGPLFNVDALEQRHYRLADAVSDAAIQLLDGDTARRQFLWVHYFDPHGPYGDSREGATINPHRVLEAARAGLDTAPLIAEARALYDLDVRYLDTALERLWSRLDRDRDELDTHVVVVADHGESFGEDGSMAHGKRLTLEELRVPCFIVSPRVSPAVHQEIASSIDVPATLYALAGITETAPGGRDLTASTPAEATAFGMRRTFAKPHDDLRLDGRLHRLDFNLFYAVGADGRLFTGNAEGMRDAPPGTDAPSPDLEHRLKILFGTFESELGGVPTRERHDPATEDALKALGYLG